MITCFNEGIIPMKKVVYITIFFISLFVSLYSINEDPKVIQYNKIFVLKKQGKVIFKMHKQLILYKNHNILEEVLKIDYISFKRRTHRTIRYKNNHFNRPLSAEIKSYLKGNLIQESKLIFQKETYSFTSTQYQTENKKLNPPKKMSRKNFTISKSPLYFNYTMDTIGIKMIKKEKKNVTYVKFPSNTLVFGDILDFQNNATLTKEIDLKKKLTTYKIRTKRGISGTQAVLIFNNKAKKVSSYKIFGIEATEIKNNQ